MNILITGAAGFIGTHLTELFLKEEHQVYAVDNLSTGDEDNIKEFYKNDSYHFYHANLANPLLCFDLEEAVEQCDLIYHLASVVGVKLVDQEPHKTIYDNLQMAMRLFPLAEKYNKKVVFTSTSEVYGDMGSKDLPFTEDMALSIKSPTKLRWGYASTKLTQEFLIHSYNFPFVIARLFNVVGPKQKGDYGMVLPRFVDWAKNNKDITIYGDGTQTRCFCHIKDCINALHEMGIYEKCNKEIINLGNNYEISIYDLAKKVIELTQSSSKINIIPYKQVFSSQHEDIYRRVPDISKLKNILGYSPKYTLDQIITEML